MLMCLCVCFLRLFVWIWRLLLLFFIWSVVSWIFEFFVCLWCWLIYLFFSKMSFFCLSYQLKFNSQWNVWSLQMQHATMINKTYSISPRLCHLISIKRWMFRKRYTIGHSSYTYTVQYKRLSHSSHNE